MSFLTPPPPIPEDKIVRAERADVVVVGEGLSGLCTALSARECGLDVLIVTASRGPVGRGGSVFAAYSKVLAEHGFEREDLDRFWLQELEGASFLPDQRKWYALLNNSEEAMDWLTDILRAAGLDVVLEDGNRGDRDTPTWMPPCTHAFVGAGVTRAGVGITLAVKALEERFLALGGRVLRSAPARQLEKKGGRVTAVLAETAEGFVRAEAAKAVVLATGDFSANPEMMRAYCPQYAPNFTADGADYDIGFNTGGGLYRGEGHLMALRAGAAWQRTWPAAAMIQGSRLGSNLPYGSHRGLRVNIRGERYCNEDMNGAYTALTTLREPKGRAFAIWGTNYARDIRWRAHGGQRDGPDDTPENVLKKWADQVAAGTLKTADTLPELIEKLGLPASTLDTIEHYNAICREGKDPDFHKSPAYLQEIREAPFYGGELNDIRFFTVLGGPRTDAALRVCDADDEPIPGLYCVGSMVGDMYANYYNFRIPGQNYGACLTFGYLLGRSLAK
jgi:succinate dehydrogenase/fumarate reductase flavoprotein subunit